MTTPKTIEDFGGPYFDAMPPDNPETDMGADHGNPLLECVAQMTHTADKADVHFATTAAAAPAAVTPLHKSQWGDGAGQRPTVTKAATGLYSIIYAGSFPSLTEPGTGGVETLGFFSALPKCWTTDPLDKLDTRLVGISAHQVDIAVYANGALADVGDHSGSLINVDLWIK